MKLRASSYTLNKDSFACVMISIYIGSLGIINMVKICISAADILADAFISKPVNTIGWEDSTNASTSRT